MSVDPNNFGVRDFAFPVGSGGSDVTYPDPSDVRYGVQYGPDGNNYTGTLGGAGGDGTQHSPADVLRYVLILLNQGVDPVGSGDWPVYCSGEPQEPEACITTYDAPGIDQGRLNPTGARQERFGVQVRVRAKDSHTAHAKVKDIAETLDTVLYQETVSIGSASYLVWAVKRTGPPLSIGKDTPNSKRNKFTLNLITHIRRLV